MKQRTWPSTTTGNHKGKGGIKEDYHRMDLRRQRAHDIGIISPVAGISHLTLTPFCCVDKKKRKSINSFRGQRLISQKELKDFCEKYRTVQ